jgi:hypothetical protein
MRARGSSWLNDRGGVEPARGDNHQDRPAQTKRSLRGSTLGIGIAAHNPSARRTKTFVTLSMGVGEVAAERDEGAV